MLVDNLSFLTVGYVQILKIENLNVNYLIFFLCKLNFELALVKCELAQRSSQSFVHGVYLTCR